MNEYFPSSYTGIDSPNLSRIGIGVLILAVIIVCVYTYKWYMKRTQKEITVPGPYALSTETVTNPWTSLLSAEQSQKLTSVNNTTLSFFTYVEKQTANLNPLTVPDGDYSRLNYLIALGYSLGIKIDPIHEKAIVDIYSVGVPGDNKSITVKRSIVVDNVPILRWNQITITIEGRTVDIYINGVLATSTLLENVPFSEFFGIWLNKSPDFMGQVCLFQIWSERRTATQILENYKRNTDIRGKPLVPDFRLEIKHLLTSFCSMTGICGFQFETGPLKYIDYEFA